MAKPQTATGYSRGQTDLARSTCLYVATKLGDLMDELVIVGGLVPSLLIDQSALPAEIEAHVGTMDLDLGLTLALLDDGRYHTLTERLRQADFEPDVNDAGNKTRQRWRLRSAQGVAVDFLIQPSLASDVGGKLRNIESDFAALIAPGLKCAFVDRDRVVLNGRTPAGEKASREVWCCGAGAYVVLKALAFDGRGENKDAYDLHYVIRNYGSDVHDVARRLRTLLGDDDAKRALEILKRDFLDPDALGPRRVAMFIRGRGDDELQADVVGFVSRLLALLEDDATEI